VDPAEAARIAESLLERRRAEAGTPSVPSSNAR